MKKRLSEDSLNVVQKKVWRYDLDVHADERIGFIECHKTIQPIKEYPTVRSYV